MISLRGDMMTKETGYACITMAQALIMLGQSKLAIDAASEAIVIFERCMEPEGLNNAKALLRAATGNPKPVGPAVSRAASNAKSGPAQPSRSSKERTHEPSQAIRQ